MTQEYIFWTLLRSSIRAALFLWFVWPLSKGQRSASKIAAALLLVICSEAIRILPLFSGGGLSKALPRQLLLILGAYGAARVLLPVQRLYAFYVSSVFSFALAIWKNLISPYVLSFIPFPPAFLQDGLSFIDPVRTTIEFVIYTLTLLLLKKTFFTMEQDRRMRANQVFLVLFPLFSNWVILVALYNSFFFEQTLENYRYGSDLILVFYLLAAASLSIIVIAEWYFRMDRKKELLRQEQQLLEDSYERMETQRRADESLRMLEHDMKNHLVTLSKLSGQSSEAGRYIETLIENIQKNTSSFQTGNATLDAVLSQKEQLCREKGLTFESYADLRKGDFLEPMEVCTLFANCLDNAIEAAERVEGGRRAVVVSCAAIGGCIVAKFTNPCEKPPLWQNGRPVTQKKDAEKHGYGLRSVSGIVERRGGALRLNCENGLFTATWMIPIPQKN